MDEVRVVLGYSGGASTSENPVPPISRSLGSTPAGQSSPSTSGPVSTSRRSTPASHVTEHELDLTARRWRRWDECQISGCDQHRRCPVSGTHISAAVVDRAAGAPTGPDRCHWLQVLWLPSVAHVSCTTSKVTEYTSTSRFSAWKLYSVRARPSSVAVTVDVQVGRKEPSLEASQSPGVRSAGRLVGSVMPIAEPSTSSSCQAPSGYSALPVRMTSHGDPRRVRRRCTQQLNRTL